MGGRRRGAIALTGWPRPVGGAGDGAGSNGRGAFSFTADGRPETFVAKFPPLRPDLLVSARIGRVERALDKDLAGAPEISPGARAHLRAQARAVDVAELDADVWAVSKASATYLELRQAYGLAGANRESVDPFAAFVAGLSAPSMGDPADT